MRRLKNDEHTLGLIDVLAIIGVVLVLSLMQNRDFQDAERAAVQSHIAAAQTVAQIINTNTNESTETKESP